VEGYARADDANAILAVRGLAAHVKRRGVTDVRLVKESDVVSYLRELAQTMSRRGRPYSPWTLRVQLGHLKRFFAFQVQRRVVFHNVAEDVQLPRLTWMPRQVLSEAQARRLMAAPMSHTVMGKRDRGVLEVLYGTGMRVSECARLDLQDLDLSSGSVLVRNGKGRRDRVVPISGRAVRALLTYLSESRPALLKRSRETALFLSQRRGLRLTSSAIQSLVARHARLARIPQRVGPHALRHSYATHLLKGGAGVRQVQALLGHRDIKVTSRYTRVALTDLRVVIARAHPRERGSKRGVGGRIRRVLPRSTGGRLGARRPASSLR
jgi:integrase/recombinase XerD